MQNSFTGAPITVSNLNSKATVLSEFEEIVHYLVPESVIEVLNQFEKYFVRIHVSDQGIASLTQYVQLLNLCKMF